MKKISLLICLLSACLILAGCTGSGSPPETSQPKSVTSEIKDDILSAVDLSVDSGLNKIYVFERDEGIQISVSLVPPFRTDDFGSYAGKFCLAAKDALSSRSLSLDSFSFTYDDKNGNLLSWDTEDFENGFYLSEASKTAKSITISELSGISTSSKSKYDIFLEENNVTLTADDVRYNMTNHLEQYFSLCGTAKLSDYYNYGFDSNLEGSYFCMRVTPDGGSLSDSWYIYCHRDSFEELFDDLKSDSVYVKTVCIIPEYRYEKNQSDMAQLHYVSW